LKSNTAHVESFNPCPKGLAPRWVLLRRKGGVLLLALCPLADSRRQRQRRTALESGTWWIQRHRASNPPPPLTRCAHCCFGELRIARGSKRPQIHSWSIFMQVHL